MKTKTIIEKKGLKDLSKRSMGKLEVVIDKKIIEKSVFDTLGRYFDRKSPKTIIEEVFCYTASALTKPDWDLLEHASLDKLDIIRKLQDKNNKHRKNNISNDDYVKARVPLWQLIIIASESKDIISSEEQLIKSALTLSYNRLALFFGEEEKIG